MPVKAIGAATVGSGQAAVATSFAVAEIAVKVESMMMEPIPQVTLEQFEAEYRDRHLIHAAVDYWAARQPDGAAIVNATRGTPLTWRELQRGSLAMAAGLARMGFRKGDFLAASLPLLDEHILLEYACFRLGVIHAPLDLRLQPAEVLRCLSLIRAARATCFREDGAADFAALGEAVRAQCDSVEHLMQFSPAGRMHRRRRQLRRSGGARAGRPPRRSRCHRSTMARR